MVKKKAKASIAKITDIARLAGVSRSTVSRVLTNNANVKDETARRVREAMEAANYRPNILARGLATGRLNIVALLLSETDNPFWIRIGEYLDTELRRLGHILSICYLGKSDADRVANLRAVQEYGFSGFIVGDIRNEGDFVEEIQAVKRPLVFFDRYIESLSDFDAIVVDNYLGGHMVGKHLTGLGHRDIAMLTGPLRASSSRDRFHGFRDALIEAGLDLSDEMIGEGDLSPEAGRAFAQLVLSRRKKRDCTAIFAGNDAMAMGILDYCRENGVGVPDEVSLAGFDDMEYAGSPLISLTTVQQPHAKMSALTAERIAARMRGDESLSRQCIMLDPRLVIRKTTGPAP